MLYNPNAHSLTQHRSNHIFRLDWPAASQHRDSSSSLGPRSPLQVMSPGVAVMFIAPDTMNRRDSLVSPLFLLYFRAIHMNLEYRLYILHPRLGAHNRLNFAGTHSTVSVHCFSMHHHSTCSGVSLNLDQHIPSLLLGHPAQMSNGLVAAARAPTPALRILSSSHLRHARRNSH